MSRALYLTLAGALLFACDDPARSTSGSGGASSSSGAPTSTSPSATLSATGSPTTCGDEPEHTGDGTYYDADGSGNCSYEASSDSMVGAMNHTDYADSAACGKCVAIVGPSGSVTVRIVDQCPECAPGDIDLSPEAFEKISPLEAGRVDISWKVVSCGWAGPIQYHYKEGSNPFWSAIQIRNAQNGIASVEAMKDGGYVTLTRTDYNYFLDESGLGDGPYAFRVTDVYGNVLEDAGIPFGETQTFDGAAQFPPCDAP